MPEPLTMPDPGPATATVNVWFKAKVAVTLWSELIVTSHLPVPAQPPPLQPVNVEPGSAAANRLTVVPDP